MIIILLTACINPDGMLYTTLNDCEERKKQYVNAIRYYLSTTSLSIVFVENTNTDISNIFLEEIKKGRLECLTFKGNLNKKRGKGYGECEIIRYALEKSSLLNNGYNNRIVKITGRLIVKNLKILIRMHSFLLPHNSIICAINSDLSFPDSRCIIAPIDFYELFARKIDDIDDSIGYYFEHALLDTIIIEKEYPFSPFFIQPDIEGISGSTGEIYKGPSQNYTYKFKYMRYALSLRYKFIKKYRIE